MADAALLLAARGPGEFTGGRSSESWDCRRQKADRSLISDVWRLRSTLCATVGDVIDACAAASVASSCRRIETRSGGRSGRGPAAPHRSQHRIASTSPPPISMGTQ